MAEQNITDDVLLGANARVDDNVVLGYLTGRKIANHALRIGDGACIRTGTVIYAGTKIGRNLATGHNVTIREENEIGDNFSIWNCSTVDYGCRIGNNVKIHCNCYIAQFTTVEDDAFMAPGVTIANDIFPGDKSSAAAMKGPYIERGAQIGVNVTILPFVRLGHHCLIGAGAVVTKDVPPGAVIVGNPGRILCSIHDLKPRGELTDQPYKDIILHGSSEPRQNQR